MHDWPIGAGVELPGRDDARDDQRRSGAEMRTLRADASERRSSVALRGSSVTGRRACSFSNETSSSPSATFTMRTTVMVGRNSKEHAMACSPPSRGLAKVSAFRASVEIPDGDATRCKFRPGVRTLSARPAQDWWLPLSCAIPPHGTPVAGSVVESRARRELRRSYCPSSAGPSSRGRKKRRPSF